MVIVGGGVIGACILYSLALRGVSAEIVEQEGVAAAASGKAAGFLARDWFVEGSPRAWLMQTGFDLHAELGAKYGKRYDYRRMEALKVIMPEPGVPVSSDDAKRLQEVEALGGVPVDWLTGPILDAQQMATRQTAAQVHPKKFTQTMVELARELGGTVRHGTVQDVLTSGDVRSVCGVVVDGQVVEADCVVLAMGPWLSKARAWLGEGVPVMYGQKCHSICIPGDVSPQACFVEFTSRKTEPAGNVNPSYEVYPRPDGEIYVHGVDEHYRLLSESESRPDAIEPTAGSCAYLQQVTSYLSPRLAAAAPREQACHMPVLADGMPCIGPVQGVRGAFVASGHAEWGILMAPSTATLVASLLLDEAQPHMSERDWRSLSPSRQPQAVTRPSKTAKAM